MEKLSLITSSLLVATAAEPWQDVLSPYGTRLYEEYGRHESLQLCVKKYKEAGRPSPEALGALEWLLLHHTPEVAEREGKDPLDVLLTTVFMGCCDVDRFVSAVVKCLKDDPSVQTRLHKASKGYVRAQHDMPLTPVTLVSCMLCEFCVHVLLQSIVCVHGIYVPLPLQFDLIYLP